MTPFTLLVITLPRDKTLLLFIKLNVVVASTPLIVLDRVIVLVVLALLVVLELITDEVAETPFTVVVNTFPDKLVLSELMIFVNKVETPFTTEAKVLVVVESEFVVDEASSELKFPITALVIVALVLTRFVVLVLLTFNKLALIIFPVVVPSKDKLVNPLTVVVDTTPSTILVIRFVVDEKLKLFVVVAATKLARDVVETTPFTLLVITPVLVEKVTVLLDMTDDVALTPFIVVVNTFPVREVVRELMILAIALVTPLTIVAKVLVVVESVFVVDEASNELKFPITALVIVAFAALKFIVLVVVAVSIFALMLLAIILAAVVVPSKDKLVNPLIVVVEVMPFTTLVIKLVVDEKLRELVVDATIKLARLVVEMTPFTLVVITPVEVAKVTALFEIIVLVPTDPPTLLVNILDKLERVLLVFKLVAVKLVVTKLVPVALVNNRSVIVEVKALKRFVKRLVVVALENVTLSLSAYLTSPAVVVETVRLLLVELAKKLKRLLTDVVANTPLILVAIIPEFAEILFELISVEVEMIPFTFEVKVFRALLSKLEFTKLVVVVAILPFTILVSTKLFVVVEIVKILLVEEAIRF
jgi:hypothetical protein